MPRYEDKTAVIIGGTSGIGLGTARALVDEGARVLVTGSSEGSVRAAAETLGDRATAVRSDMTSLTDIDALAETVAGTLESIDLLFVNAGITRWIPFEKVTEADFDLIFNINAKGPYFTAQKLAPLVRDGGAIVFTTSVVDQLGYPLTSVYGASKAAVRSMTRSFARELAGRVRVNAVSPGVIDTDVLVKATSQETSDTVKAQVSQTNPMKRIGRPEEIAAAVLFLAFEATYTTGAELTVDGGTTQL